MLNSIFFHFNSIKYKFILASLTIVIIFTSLVTYLWYTKTFADAEFSSIASVSEMLKVSNENFEVTLKDVNTLVTIVSTNKENIINVLTKKTFSSDKDYLENNRKAEDFLTNFYIYKHYFSGLMVSSMEGKFFNEGTTLTFEEVKKQSWFNSIINSQNEKVLIPPHYTNKWSSQQRDDDYENMVLSIGRSIMNEGNVIGLVIADIQCYILKDIFNINLKNNGTVYIANKEKGKFIFRSGSNESSLKYSENDFKKMSDKFNSNSGSFYTHIDNKDFLVIYYYSDFTKWITIGLIPKEKMLESFIKTRNTTLVVSIAFCLITIGIIVFISSLLTRNLQKLSKAMKDVSKNNFDISVDIKSNDEIGQLYLQFNFMVAKIKELIDSIKKNEKEKRSAQIKAFQAHINPHFLYNTLNTIKFLSVIQGAENIRTVSESLSVLLHVNMEDTIFISIQDEINYIKCYLSIQEFKYNNKFTSSFTIEEGVGNYMVLKLLLQPLVENSLAHGIAPLKGEGMISLKIFKEDDMLKLRVQDNGVGMDEEQIQKVLNNKMNSNGIGINNVISRIKMNFGDNYGVSILSQKGIYTIFEISVPLITAIEVDNYA